MKKLALFGSLFALVACGYSEDKFADDFVESYCAAWDSCNTSGDACPVSASGDDDGDSECDFDATAAKDCVDGEYTCDDSLGEGLEFVLPPEVCANICG